MRTSRWRIRIAITAMAVLAAYVSPAQPADRTAKHPETVTVRANTDYTHAGMWRVFFGDEWRDVWSAEVTVPVLDLEALPAD